MANLTLIAGRMGAEGRPEHSQSHLMGSADAVRTLLDVLQALRAAASRTCTRRRHTYRYPAATRLGTQPSFAKTRFRPQF